MKYIFVLILFISSTLELFSQTPEKISYQAIIRNNDSELISNSSVSLKIIIRQNTSNGNIAYEENHAVTTNANGLVSIEIGTGSVLSGNFSSIIWFDSPYFVETQVDVSGGNDYSLVGISQLLSVPYALHAKTAENVINNQEPIPYRAAVIPLNNNRDIDVTDINNTIACITTSTITLTLNFTSMEIGDTINLEAHNGATLTIAAANGVTLNYSNSGVANFASDAGNVRFGLLRKSGANAYIISGQ